jgi:hypothetical protein
LVILQVTSKVVTDGTEVVDGSTEVAGDEEAYKGIKLKLPGVRAEGPLDG